MRPSTFVLVHVGRGERTHAAFNPHRTVCGRDAGDVLWDGRFWRLGGPDGVVSPTCRQCAFRIDRLLAWFGV
jgi:hypothetical protein